MFYNKDNPQWQFNEEQYLSQDEYYRIVGEYDELCKSMLSVDIRDMNAKFYGVKDTGTPEEQEQKRKKGIIYAVIAMMVFASLVVSLIFKQLVIFGYIVCAVLLFAGISMTVTGKGEVVESSSRAYLNGSGILYPVICPCIRTDGSGPDPDHCPESTVGQGGLYRRSQRNLQRLCPLCQQGTRLRTRQILVHIHISAVQLFI